MNSDNSSDGLVDTSDGSKDLGTRPRREREKKLFTTKQKIDVTIKINLWEEFPI